MLLLCCLLPLLLLVCRLWLVLLGLRLMPLPLLSLLLMRAHLGVTHLL